MPASNQCQGACLCGAVDLTVTVNSHDVDACHCHMCQKWGGGHLLAVECDEQVSIGGEENVGVYASSDWAERGFCRQCGTHLFYRLKEGGHYAVPAGLINNGEPWVLNQQIFIDEKPAFYAFANSTRNMTGAEVFEAFANSKD